LTRTKGGRGAVGEKKKHPKKKRIAALSLAIGLLCSQGQKRNTRRKRDSAGSINTRQPGGKRSQGTGKIGNA